MNIIAYHDAFVQRKKKISVVCTAKIYKFVQNHDFLKSCMKKHLFRRKKVKLPLQNAEKHGIILTSVIFRKLLL